MTERRLNSCCLLSIRSTVIHSNVEGQMDIWIDSAAVRMKKHV